MHMKVLVIFFISLLAIRVYASQGLLNCHIGSWNPYFRLSVEVEFTSKLYGSLVSAVNGFGGAQKKQLGRDPLEFRINPSTCTLAIRSTKNPVSDFVVHLDLNRKIKSSGKEKYKGSASGSLLAQHAMLPVDPNFLKAWPASCSIADSNFAEELSNTCNKHSSLDTEIYFNSTQQLMEIQKTHSNKVSDLKGIKTASPQNYPTYTPPKRPTILN